MSKKISKNQVVKALKRKGRVMRKVMGGSWEVVGSGERKVYGSLAALVKGEEIDE